VLSSRQRQCWRSPHAAAARRRNQAGRSASSLASSTRHRRAPSNASGHTVPAAGGRWCRSCRAAGPDRRGVTHTARKAVPAHRSLRPYTIQRRTSRNWLTATKTVEIDARSAPIELTVDSGSVDTRRVASNTEPACQRPNDIEDVRLAVYPEFATTGRAAGTEELADVVGLSVTDVASALSLLHDHRDIVLDGDGASSWRTPSRRYLSASRHGRTHPVVGRLRVGLVRDSASRAGEPSVLVATTCPGCEYATRVCRRSRPSHRAAIR